MKKSKKIAIILAISATFGGVLSSPPERTYAADIVIDTQDKFDGLNFRITSQLLLRVSSIQFYYVPN